MYNQRIMTSSEPIFAVIGILVLILSVIIHEVMHGVVALRFGDHTAERAGRLTLNPIPHIDLIGTILLPALLILSGSRIFIGWAKPVPVNPLNFTNLRKGELFVSAAGIGANFALAIVAAILFHILNTIFPQEIILYILVKFVQINLLLGVFNLLPIPPLDGSKIVMSQLSYSAASSYSRIEPYGFIIILALAYTNILNIILSLAIFPLYALLQIPLY
jgi:Zn-dependent protease